VNECFFSDFTRQPFCTCGPNRCRVLYSVFSVFVEKPVNSGVDSENIKRHLSYYCARLR